MTERSVTAKSVNEDLGELAQEVKDLGRGIDALRNEFTGFRSSVETELRLIRKLGGWFVGGLFGVFISVVVGAATVGWNASAVVAEVKYQGLRLDKIEQRQEASAEKVEKQLDTIIRQTAKPGS